MQHNQQSISQNQMIAQGSPEMTPKSSSKVSKKTLDIKKLQSQNQNLNIGSFKAFVVGICGGDCSGKRQLINCLFHKNQNTWLIANTKEEVCILHQQYYIQDTSQSFTSKAINWDRFYEDVMNLIIGNPVVINIKQTNQKLELKAAKLLIIEGCHIFISNDPNIKPLFDLINTKVFIDSQADVRLSRRIYKDTQDEGKDLKQSVENYLRFIKPSYQKEIEPSKVNSDIILPHFGGGYDDHRKKSRINYQSNIKNACALIISHVREQMKQYEEEAQEIENQKAL